MKIKVARRHQITIPEEIRKKANINVGDILEVTYEDGRIVVEKIEESWDKIMKQTRGSWNEHPIFIDIKNSVEFINWLRGKT
ncbi:MAG: AbrB/MazE/SpoVT family DNA-binding domain-containing protein [Deltaproteobacteria bacterium]|nr:AbrB/MazE/SpoVT family DNA-binding domain-containing protein [Deltaproteobacteria bacterium]